MSEQTTPMYIRFGDAPTSGQSYNAGTDQPEAGVSVYEAEWQSSDKSVICVVIPSDVCVFTLNAIEDRPVYLVEGDLLDERGGDGELLMANVRTALHGPVEVVTYVVDEV